MLLKFGKTQGFWLLATVVVALRLSPNAVLFSYNKGQWIEESIQMSEDRDGACTCMLVLLSRCAMMRCDDEAKWWWRQSHCTRRADWCYTIDHSLLFALQRLMCAPTISCGRSALWMFAHAHHNTCRTAVFAWLAREHPVITIISLRLSIVITISHRSIPPYSS